MQGGGIKASANMWALLADEDPGDNPVIKRNAAVEIGAGDVQPVAEDATSSVPDEKEQSSSVGDHQKRKKKRKNKKKPSKQHKEESKAAATVNGAGNSFDESEDSDEEEEAAVAGAGCFRALFLTAVTTALLTFCFHASGFAAL